jgi:signal transduction histidine kinase
MLRLIPSHFNLKQRVVWALTALVALFVIMQGTLAYLSMADQEDDLVDELVLAEAQRLATHIGQDEVNGMQTSDLLILSPHFAAWVQDGEGNVTPGPLPDELKTLALGPHRLTTKGAELHVYVMQTAEGRLYVRYDAEQHEDKVREFGLYLIGLGVLCIALAGLAATQIAVIVVAPIERLTRRLSEWAPGDLTAEEADEEARLVASFRRVQERFEEGIAHEREFVANARHEVRTPLTALRTDLEMLALHADAEMQPRLQRALATVDEITGSLDLVHTLSQRHALRIEPVELAACVDAAWASLSGLGEMLHLQLTNLVEAKVSVNADRHALLTILRNLIRNAAEHGAATHCKVHYTTRGIEVSDDGVGIAAADLPLIFDRYYRSRRVDAPDQGADSSPRGERGLGLAIARQIADLNGWSLTVESAPGSGTCFILGLKHAS